MASRAAWEGNNIYLLLEKVDSPFYRKLVISIRHFPKTVRHWRMAKPYFAHCLTTFITPWGRFRYLVTPQGATASGDGYPRRYDNIIADGQRKTKIVDDTAMLDEYLESHWWRVIDFLILAGENGIVLNPEKLQFAQREIDFAGFRISEKKIQPAPKFLNSIRDFPMPTKITDVRSWFGLVNQVGHYDKLTDIMLPFKRLLSSTMKFFWTE